MHASDGAHEDIHKKVLGPNAELHEAHRQVNVLLTLNFIDSVEFSDQIFTHHWSLL